VSAVTQRWMSGATKITIGTMLTQAITHAKNHCCRNCMPNRLDWCTAIAVATAVVSAAWITEKMKGA